MSSSWTLTARHGPPRYQRVTTGSPTALATTQSTPASRSAGSPTSGGIVVRLTNRYTPANGWGTNPGACTWVSSTNASRWSRSAAVAGTGLVDLAVAALPEGLA